MNCLSRRNYDQLLQQLNQRPIRANRYKLTLYTPLRGSSSNSLQGQEPELTMTDNEGTVFAFNLMFERNNAESAWRLVTPLKIIE